MKCQKESFGEEGGYLYPPPGVPGPAPPPPPGCDLLHVKLFSLKFVCLFVCFGGRGEGTYTLSGWAHSCEVFFLRCVSNSIQGVWCLDTSVLLVISRTLLLYIEEAFIRLFSILICLDSMLPITHPRPLPRVRHFYEFGV